ncbi:MAG: FliI/YscN family ATPase [Treponema sp.]|jgi:flagellum-specific ATP synthase|nr:FliI/YscN family ATPase [Treponema sp.]
METIIDKYLKIAENIDPIKCVGHVSKVQGLLIESVGPSAIIGEICRIETGEEIYLQAEVVGLRVGTVQLMAYSETSGIRVGDRVVASGSSLDVAVSDKLLGRVLDAQGKAVDGKGDIESGVRYPVMASPPDPLKRARITKRVATGVRAIDSMLAVGRGQRIGIFAGSGVGKSTLLGMIARNTNADVNVVALIGERGREVNDFIEKDLGEEGLKRSALVVTPSNSPPLLRLRGAYTATAVAEYFRDKGKNVMLLFDSITRFARAMREIGLATGEPPATRGYPPSMFDQMPKLLERSGAAETGSITSFYTILVDGDDMDEPVADTVRGILDGHIVLSRKLAQYYHYPAIDVLRSVSRLEKDVSGPATQQAVGVIRRLMAIYDENEKLINVGAYHAGTNALIDNAIAKHDSIENFLMQDIGEKAAIRDTLVKLGELAGVTIPEEELSAEPSGAANGPRMDSTLVE